MSVRHRTLNFQHWLDFLLAMTEKEIKARYKRAILGFFWLLINPISQMLVMGFIFQFFVPVKIDNYFLYLFAGLLPWNFFAQSVTKSTPAFFYERSLIKKAKFPSEAIVLSIVLSNFFHFLIALGLLITLLLADKVFLDHYSFGALINYIGQFLTLLPALLLLLTFTALSSLLFATLNVRFRDMNFIVPLTVNLWFYATPVIYSLSLLPEIIWPLAYLNPLTLIVELFHRALLGQSLTLPTFISVSLVMILLTIYLAIYLFRRQSPNFDDWL